MTSYDTSPIIDYTDTENTLKVIFKKPSDRYLTEFIRLRAAPDLLKWKVFPNAKEITESMAAFNAVRRFLGADWLGKEDIKCFVVGDGVTPRTGAIFATRTRWEVMSIDPELRVKDYGIKRLLLEPKKVEDVEIIPSKTMNVVVAVHSHAPLQPMWKKLAKCPRWFVAIPCCFRQEIEGQQPSKVYVDWGIHSPKRTIKIWRVGYRGKI